ncbi:Glycogen phosphorylase [Beijerinckiaceae bacterium RH AL1]|nr:Glycogen phosphorylase [Beijerinckiaceae bacterium RH CH11]VVB49149.1 Glycogen phosphorylase [Beijerinckiaceae bacterium RH AL8]VVC56712.1 Glycogen phosphorylase [Beijerinckiaceae bacterium RH AL1]
MTAPEVERRKPEPVKSRMAPTDSEELREAILAKLIYSVGKDIKTASPRDWFVALALATRDRIVDRWMSATRRSHQADAKQVYYLSVEFLIGRLLMDGLNNLGLTEPAREALAALGVDLDQIRQEEPDAALGNGGLGRLAACFMESMASVGLPAYGYGIRYEHGLFRQMISDGWQHEAPEDWLAHGNPWEFERPEVVYPIHFGGFVEQVGGDTEDAPLKNVWHPRETVNAVAYDTPIIGWQGRHANTLRLWSARAVDPIDLIGFNRGDHVGSFTARAYAESISRVLYPSDETSSGQALRLRQEYFFTSASLQDLVRRHLSMHKSLDNLAEHAAIHMNDTHPAIAVAELMRLLVDEHDMLWRKAWGITQSTLNYTNHTLLPEALEAWPLALMNDLLPRHMQIIFLINHKHLKQVPDAMKTDVAKLASVSLIEEGDQKRVRMGHLAFIGSRRINGVSALHTELMKQTIFSDLNAIYPGRIVNKTNGITFRRWLMEANPELTKLIVETLSPKVLDDPNQLVGLAAYADDKAFQDKMKRVRRRKKEALAAVIHDRLGVKVSTDALFDVQIKRIHEYKRQLLNILQTAAMYREMKLNPSAEYAPRVKIFAGKAAASYARAKLIIKLANDVANVVNNDPDIGDKLKVAFLPNYNVSLAEVIIPAADLSEQISTAGMEASGTGNMKMALNGALTIGTMDGANIEISEAVGLDNIFIFGMTTPEVEARREQGFRGRDALINSYRLKDVLDAIYDGQFSPDDRSRFHSLVDAVLGYDTFMVGADFEFYFKRQRDVDTLWADQPAWAAARTKNIAGMGWFSSDRTIREYADEIWQAPTL